MQRPARWTGQTTRTARILGTLAAVCLSQVWVPTASAADSVACSWVLDVQNRLTDRLTVERAVRVDAPRFQPEDIACLCEGGAPLWVVQIAREELLLDGWAAREANALPLYAPESTFPVSKQVALALVAQLRQSPSLYAEDGFYFQPFAGEAGAPTWFEMDRFSEAFTDASIALDASRSRRLALRVDEVEGIDRRRLATLANGPSDTGYDRVTRYLKPRASAFLALQFDAEGEDGTQVSVRIDRFGEGKAKTTDTGILMMTRNTEAIPACDGGRLLSPNLATNPVADVGRLPANQARAIRLKRWYAWTGVGLAAVGGVLTAVSYAQHERVLRNPASFFSPAQQLGMWQNINIAAGAVAIAGGAAGAIGFALPIPKRVRAAQREDAR